MFSCSVCNLVFNNATNHSSHLNGAAHLKKIAAQTAYKCKFCVRTFDNLTNLQSHEASHAKKVLPIVHKCKYCFRTFNNITNPVSHKLGHERYAAAPSIVYKCKICSRTFNNSTNLLTHEATHVTKKVLKYRCDVCDRDFGSIENLNYHLSGAAHKKVVAQGKQSTGDCCEIVLPSRVSPVQVEAMSTVKSHCINGIYRCSVCPFMTNKVSAFDRHQTSHGKDVELVPIVSRALENHKCALCPFKCIEELEFNRHVSISHPGFMQCLKCNCLFLNDKDSFYRHLETVHKNPRSFDCNICQKTFSSTNALNQHHRFKHSSKFFNCTKCSMSFKFKHHLLRHEQQRHCTTTIRYRCNDCPRVYSNIRFFEKHKQMHKRPYSCTLCQQEFLFKSRLKIHMRTHFASRRGHNLLRQHQTPSSVTSKITSHVSCHNCDKQFTNRYQLNFHLRHDCFHLTIPSVDHLLQSDSLDFTISSPLKGSITSLTVMPTNTPVMVEQFFSDLNPTLKCILKYFIEHDAPVKWSFVLHVLFQKQTEDVVLKKEAYFHNDTFAIDNIDDSLIDSNLDHVVQRCLNLVEKFTDNGSGWEFVTVLQMDVNFYRVLLQRGGSYVDLPPKLKDKQCVINIDTKDCFKYAVLSALHHAEIDDPKNKIFAYSYQAWLDDFAFPSSKMVNAADIAIFCKTSNLAIYTHTYDEKHHFVECTFRPPLQDVINKPRVHLLCYKNHWMAITNLSGLYNDHSRQVIMCDCCLAKFHNHDRYNQHLPCSPKRYIQNEIMPVEHPWLEFKDFNKCVDLPDVLYADIEAVLESYHDDSGKILQKHVPCCAGAYHVSKVSKSVYTEFKGQDCMQQFIEFLDTKVFELYH